MYETDRLILKVLDGEYSHFVADYYKRNIDFLSPWESERREIFYTSKFQNIQLERDLVDVKRGKLLVLWIFKKDKKQRLIGNISFNNIIRGNFLSCHVGYRLDKDEINKGYMTEALRLAIQIMFMDYELHRIEANVMINNYSSLRITEKLGFLKEGISRKYLKVNGIWQDHVNMVLLNENIV